MPPKQDMNKVMSDKVARVREVVRGSVKNEDIVLALHSFDLNVEKTIQAFCEGGASEVLDDWVRPAGGGKKNKKKNNGSVNGGQSVVQPPVQQKTSTSTSIITNPEQTPAIARQNSAGNGQVQKKKAKPVTEAPKLNGNSGAGASKSKAQARETVSVAIPHETHPAGSIKDQIHKAFESLRVALNQREKQLLASANDASLSFSFDEHLRHLIHNFGQLNHTSNGPLANGKPTSAASKAGSPDLVAPPAVQAIKHTTSQSSLSSSVGADSGVNLSPTHKEEKRVTAAASAPLGGIAMSSESLSADQLAEIQRVIQLQLAAKGIDPALMASCAASAPAPPRRPRKDGSDNQKKGGNAAGGGNKNSGPQHNNNNNSKVKNPKLSIL